MKRWWKYILIGIGVGIGTWAWLIPIGLIALLVSMSAEGNELPPGMHDVHAVEHAKDQFECRRRSFKASWVWLTAIMESSPNDHLFPEGPLEAWPGERTFTFERSKVRGVPIMIGENLALITTRNNGLAIIAMIVVDEDALMDCVG